MKRIIFKYSSIALLIAAFILSSCSRPNEVHNRKEMEKIMYDIYIAEAMIENDYSTFGTPEQKEALINEVFKKHKTTQARWDTSLSWYSDKVEIYLKMNDSVRARLQRKQKYIESIVNNELAMEQSVKDRTILTTNIPKHYSFSEVNPKNGFRFRYDSTQIKQELDSIDLFFTFDAIGIPKSFAPILISQLMLEYKDTTIYKSELIFENKHYSTPIERYIDSDTLLSILGSVRLQDTLQMFKDIQLLNIQLGNPDSLSIEIKDTIQQKDLNKLEKLDQQIVEQETVTEEVIEEQVAEELTDSINTN